VGRTLAPRPGEQGGVQGRHAERRKSESTRPTSNHVPVTGRSRRTRPRRLSRPRRSPFRAGPAGEQREAGERGHQGDQPQRQVRGASTRAAAAPRRSRAAGTRPGRTRRSAQGTAAGRPGCGAPRRASCPPALDGERVAQPAQRDEQYAMTATRPARRPARVGRPASRGRARISDCYWWSRCVLHAAAPMARQATASLQTADSAAPARPGRDGT